MTENLQDVEADATEEVFVAWINGGDVRPRRLVPTLPWRKRDWHSHGGEGGLAGPLIVGSDAADAVRVPSKG